MESAWPWVSVGILVVALLLYLLRRARREAARLAERLEGASMALQRLQRSFSRFAPEPVVERIISGGLPTIGESKEVTVLFADLMGFTALAEGVEPSLLVEIVNGYFERMSRAIAENSGHVSTFIGDGILALFGALEPNPWQGNDAAHAALAMRAGLEHYNRELEAKGLPQLSIGVGLHRGTGVAGLVGSEDKKEFAIVGRTVNVAARVEDLTRVHRVDILLTEDLRETLDPRFVLRSLPPAELRGITKPMPIYALECFAEPS
jgi:adenylate cyclase